MIFNNSESKKREKCKDSSNTNRNHRRAKESCDNECELACKCNAKPDCQFKSVSLMACCKPGCSKIKPCLSCTRGGVIPIKPPYRNKTMFVSNCCPIEPIVSCEEPKADICCIVPCIKPETDVCIDSCNVSTIVEGSKLCRPLKTCSCDCCKNVRFNDKCEIIPPCCSETDLCSSCVSSECKPSQSCCGSKNKCLPASDQSSCLKSYSKPKCSHSNSYCISDSRKCGAQCEPIQPCVQYCCPKSFCTSQCTPDNPCQLSDCTNKSCRPKCLPSRPCCHQSCTKSYCKPKCCPSSPCCQLECSRSYCTLKCTASKPCLRIKCKKSYCGLKECENKIDPECQQITSTFNKTNTFSIPNYWQNEDHYTSCGNANCSSSLLMYKQSHPPPCHSKRSRQNINHPEYN